MKNRVIIDDEADYASPDSNINRDQDPTKINLLVDSRDKFKIISLFLIWLFGTFTSEIILAII